MTTEMNLHEVPALGLPADKPGFNATIIYDHPESARRAAGLVRSVTRHLGDDVLVRSDAWRFDVLELPAFSEAARASAARADLLVVAADVARNLPAGVKSWLEQWSANGAPTTGAIAAVLRADSTPAKPGPVRHFLESIARRGRREFFVGEYAATPTALGADFDEIDQRVRQSSSVLHDIMEQRLPMPRWGINE